MDNVCVVTYPRTNFSTDQFRDRVWADRQNSERLRVASKGTVT